MADKKTKAPAKASVPPKAPSKAPASKKPRRGWGEAAGALLMS